MRFLLGGSTSKYQTGRTVRLGNGGARLVLYVDISVAITRGIVVVVSLVSLGGSSAGNPKRLIRSEPPFAWHPGRAPPSTARALWRPSTLYIHQQCLATCRVDALFGELLTSPPNPDVLSMP